MHGEPIRGFLRAAGECCGAPRRMSIFGRIALATPDIADIKRRMDSALETLRKEFGGLRTGRASANLLDPVMVDAYGSSMPMNQVGTVSVPEPRMLTVQVWDKGLVKA